MSNALSNEVKYKMALNFLKKLLNQELITLDEFEIADRLNAEKYMVICL